MNYRGETANLQNKYNNSLNDDATGNVVMQQGRQLKVSLKLGTACFVKHMRAHVH